jgi:hypothetical protein
LAREVGEGETFLREDIYICQAYIFAATFYFAAELFSYFATTKPSMFLSHCNLFGGGVPCSGRSE